MTRRIVLVASFLVFLSGSPAGADPVVFSTLPGFLAATGSTLQPLPFALEVVSFAAGNLSFTLGPGPAFFAVGDPQYGDLVPGNDLLLSGPESFDVTLSSSVFAFGFHLYEPTSNNPFNGCNTTCVDSTFVITLYSGSTAIGVFTVQPTDNQLEFIGFWSSTAFDRVTVRETVGTNDNEYFGGFYTGTTAATVVPEPATILLCGTGLAGIVLKRRSRRSAV